MDFGRIAAKLRASHAGDADIVAPSPTASSSHSDGAMPSTEGEEATSVEGNGGVAVGQEAEAVSGTVASVALAAVVPYASVPAFTRDMNLVFSNVRRLWPPGSLGGENRLTQAADSLKMAFDARWKDLAPRLHSIQVKSIVYLYQVKGREGPASSRAWAIE